MFHFLFSIIRKNVINGSKELKHLSIILDKTLKPFVQSKFGITLKAPERKRRPIKDIILY